MSWLSDILRTATFSPQQMTMRDAVPAPAPRIVLNPPPVAVKIPTPLLTAATLSKLGVQNAAAWAAILAPLCAAHGITSRLRLAAFLANVLHETLGFSKIVESLNYNPQGLRNTWPTRFTVALANELGRLGPRPADQRAIAEIAYGGRMGNRPGTGDGFLFRGCGLMQTTGRENHERMATLLGCRAEEVPARLATREGAALSACVFWRDNGCNAPADRGDIRGVRVVINGGLNGIDDVEKRYAAACAVLGV